MRSVVLTGWGQQVDALLTIAPQAEHIDYAECDSPDELFSLLEIRQSELLIGWSLGGQLAVRAVAGGYVRPRCLVLLAPAFQCAADSAFTEATPRAILEKFRQEYNENPAQAGRSFQYLLAMGDSREREIAALLAAETEIANKEKWLPWFDELLAFSALNMDFDGFPPTLIIHGDKDKVIPLAQAEAYAAAIPQARLEVLEGSAHAPQMHDAQYIINLINQFIKYNI